MEWFFEKRGKSVASNAQRVVADMHMHLDIQTKKAKEMEEILLKFKELNMSSLEKEIVRLQKRKTQLLQELEGVDQAMIEATASLTELQERMERAINMPVPELTTGLNRPIVVPHGGVAIAHKPTISPTTTALPAQPDIVVSDATSMIAPTKVSVELNEVTKVSIELNETTMIHAMLKKYHPEHLFYIHQNQVESLIIYQATLDGPEPITCEHLVNYRDSEGRELTPAEDTMYGVRIVPNHQRDFPHVFEMACPPILVEPGVIGSPGALLAAFEIALTSAVIIDAWQNNEGLVWATTTIDGHSFAILENMYVVSEVSWGLQSIVQVDLVGRDPATGVPIVEHVSASDEGDDT